MSRISELAHEVATPHEPDIAAGGRVTATSNQARQMQFALKYIF